MSTVVDVLFYVCVATLVVLLLREFRFAMRSIRALRWRKVAGLLAHEDTGSGDQTEGPEFERGRIRYSYTIDEKDFSSNCVGFGFPYRNERLVARGVRDSLLSGAPNLTVFYDPRKPEDSVLIAGFQRFHAVKTGVLLFTLLILFGVFSWFFIF